MEEPSREIIILKPTLVFHSLLSSKLPQDYLPSSELLQADPSAYILKKSPNEDQIINYINSHFKTIFQHEISRWIEPHLHDEIPLSIFDFFCCFKFELHSHLLLMDSTVKNKGQALSIEAKPAFLNWLKNIMKEENDVLKMLNNIEPKNLSENATVVVKYFDNLYKIQSFIRQNYLMIFESEMKRLFETNYRWPTIKKYEEFNRLFLINIHTQLMELN